jgi:hypothetical protein
LIATLTCPSSSSRATRNSRAPRGRQRQAEPVDRHALRRLQLARARLGVERQVAEREDDLRPERLLGVDRLLAQVGAEGGYLREHLAQAHAQVGRRVDVAVDAFTR